MALFGSKKSKETQTASDQPKTQTIHGPKDQQYVNVNGFWFANPDYDPSYVKPEPKPLVKVKIKFGSDRVRSQDLEIFLDRNPDAILVKLNGHPEDAAKYAVGNLCYIEQDDDEKKYNVTVGKYKIGSLPDEAIAFAKKIDYIPECLVSIIGKIEYGADKSRDEIYIYIAE